MAFTWIYLFLLVVNVGRYAKATLRGSCQNPTVPLCKDLDYPHGVYLPNFLNHTKQDDAGLEVHQFFPLIKVRCSRALKHFLCALYVPRCYIVPPFSRPPCRELCEAARNGCDTLMSKFGFQWPNSMQCEKFPRLDGDGLCYIPTPGMTTTTTTTTTTTPSPHTAVPTAMVDHRVPVRIYPTQRTRPSKRRLGYKRFLSIFRKTLFGMKEELSSMLDAISEE